MDYRALAAEVFSSLLPSSKKPVPNVIRPPSPPPPSKPFSQFSQLPVELRLKIWNYAIHPRIISIHRHTYHPSDSEAQQYLPSTEGEFRASYGYDNSDTDDQRPCNMVVTPCIGNYPCRCSYYPPKSRSIQALPAALFVCHESREVGINRYSRFLEDEYDNRGLPVPTPHSKLVKSSPKIPPETGILINPNLDALHIRANVASRHSIQELIHLLALLSHTNLTQIPKVIIALTMAMMPYKFQHVDRFNYWKAWGETAWWVPVKLLVKMKGLREVVIVLPGEPINEGKQSRKMLPLHWVVRTDAIWREEMGRVKDEWPGEWRGVMPELKFVGSLEDA